MTATRNGQEIVVEIKSFVSPSLLEAMYGAVGQYTMYRLALARQQTSIPLYLAINTDAWKLIVAEQMSVFFEELSVRLLIFNTEEQRID